MLQGLVAKLISILIDLSQLQKQVLETLILEVSHLSYASQERSISFRHNLVWKPLLVYKFNTLGFNKLKNNVFCK